MRSCRRGIGLLPSSCLVRLLEVWLRFVEGCAARWLRDGVAYQLALGKDVAEIAVEIVLGDLVPFGRTEDFQSVVELGHGGQLSLMAMGPFKIEEGF